MMPAANNDVFTANRATGRIAVSVSAVNGVTRRAGTYEDGSMRIRFPNPATDNLEAVLVNTAGGVAGGDRFSVELNLGPDAKMVVGAAAAEKIYRSNGPAAEISIRVEAGAGASLAWLPQETILFDRAKLVRRVDLDMAADASVLFCESVIFGRGAMGEAVSNGRFTDRWRVRRGGKLLFADTIRLDGAIADKLAEKAAAFGAAALATLLVIPGDDSIAAKVRGLDGQLAGEVGVSAWNGLALVRFCARDGAVLRHDLMSVLTALAICPLPRLWLS